MKMNMIFSWIVMIWVADSTCGTVNYSHNYVVNGDFEADSLGGLNDMEAPGVVSGWTYDVIQLGRGPHFNPGWDSQMVELATNKDQNYSQIIPLAAGTYLLTFQHAARNSKPVSTSGIDVHWNGVVIFSYIAVDKLVHTESMLVEGMNGNNQLILQSTPNNDGFGMGVDNVQLYAFEDGNREEVVDENNSTACDCKYGYFEDGVNWICVQCSAISPYCQDCEYDISNTTSNNTNISISLFTCTACPNATYSDGTMCIPCSTVIDACVQCTIDGLVCTQCEDNYFLYDVGNDSLGYAVLFNTSLSNDTICVYCPVEGCVSCANITACDVCNQTEQYFLNDSTLLCESCALQACLNCTSLFQCEECDEQSQYFLNISTGQCQPCSIVGCSNCSSLTACFQCNQTMNYFLNSSTSLCQQCVLPQCFQCSTLSQCAVCNQNNQYFLNATTLSCEQCALAECTNCSSLTQCYQCNTSLQYFLNFSTYLCEQCSIVGCVECFSLVECSSCDDGMGYSLEMRNGSMVCEMCNVSCGCDGYVLPWNGSSCSSVCGDGYARLDEQCDDGNVVGGDGCSSICELEACNWRVGMRNVERTGCNAFKVEMKQQQCISKSFNVSSNTDLTLLSSSTSGSSIQLQFSYTTDILAPITLSLTNPSNISTTIQFDYTSLLPALYYSQAQCDAMEAVDTYLLGVMILSYLLLLVGLGSVKLVGLEMFGLLQICYIDIAPHSYLNVYLYPLRKFVAFTGISTSLMSESGSLPVSLEEMGMQVLFLNNFNIMLFAFFIHFALAMLIKAVGYCSRLQLLSKFFPVFLKQGFITLLLFSACMMGFSAGVYITYSGDSVINTFFVVCGLVGMVGGMLVLELSRPEHLGEFKQMFKQDAVCQLYVVLSIVYRVGVSVYVGVMHEYEVGTLVVVGMSLLFLLYNFVSLPYRSILHNYRSNLIHVSCFIMLLCTNIYRSMKSTTPIDEKGRFYQPAIVVLVAIGICLVLSYATLAYEIYKVVKGKCKQKLKKVSLEERSHFTIEEVHSQHHYFS